jgi:hypothetical protein
MNEVFSPRYERRSFNSSAGLTDNRFKKNGFIKLMEIIMNKTVRALAVVALVGIASVGTSYANVAPQDNTQVSSLHPYDGEASPLASLHPYDGSASPLASLKPYDGSASPLASLKPYDGEAAPLASLKPYDGEAAPLASLHPYDGSASPLASLHPYDDSASPLT